MVRKMITSGYRTSWQVQLYFTCPGMTSPLMPLMLMPAYRQAL
jgi:hypothetical protein